jgi:hypothetical protein
MIFGSLGLLVVAGGLLAAGIAKSSTGYLVLSFIATAAAGVLLLATYATARSRAVSAAGGTLPPAGFPGGGVPGTQPVVMYLPVSQVPGALQAVGAAGTAPGGNGSSFPAADNAAFAPSTPFLGYDDMTADQVVKLVGSGALTEGQLSALHEYESRVKARKTVLDRIDRALK